MNFSIICILDISIAIDITLSWCGLGPLKQNDYASVIQSSFLYQLSAVSTDEEKAHIFIEKRLVPLKIESNLGISSAGPK